MKLISNHLTGIVVVVSGVIIVSFDALFIRLIALDTVSAVFWRSLCTFAALSVVVLLKERGNFFLPFRRSQKVIFLSTLCGTAGSFGFVAGVTHIPTVNALLYIATLPFIAAIFSRLLLKEKMAKVTLAASMLIFIALFILVAGSIGHSSVYGHLFAMLTPVALGLNLTVLRRFPQIDIIAAYLLGALQLTVITLFFSLSRLPDAGTFLYIFIHGMLLIPIAMVLIFSGTKYITSAEVGLLLIGETLFAPIWTWLFLDEKIDTQAQRVGLFIITVLIVHSIYKIKKAE